MRAASARSCPTTGPTAGRWRSASVLVVVGNVFTLVIPDFLRRGIDAVARGAPLRTVAWLGAGIVGAALLGGRRASGCARCSTALSRWIEYDLRNALFRHLETLEPAFYHRTPTGDIMARATNDLAAVRMAAGPAIMYLTDTVSRTVMAVPLMVRIDGRLTAPRPGAAGR